MKKLLSTAAILCAAGISAANAGTAGFYASEKLALSFTKINDLTIDVSGTVMDGTSESDTAFGSRTAVGYNFGTIGAGDIRAELEFGFGETSKYETTNTHPLAGGAKLDVDTNTLTVVANAYYDVDTGTKFTPYVGVGAGWARLSADTAPADGIDTAKISKDGFVWNVGAGLAYKLCDNLTLDLGYRWTSFGEFSGKTQHNGYELKGSLSQHEILLGARYKF
jgi:outer membrane autotransporter protein